MFGAGAISMTFWCRRWIEQSRSNRCITWPWAVGQDLHLDVPRTADGLLDERRRIAEGALGLAHRGLDRLPQPGRVVDPAHAAAAAAGDRLDEDRKADLLGAGDQLVEVGRRRGRSQRRDPGGPGRLQGPDLVAGQLQHVGRRADEGDPGVDAGPRQVRVLAQEPVAGVDGVRPGLAGRADDLGDVEVRPDRVPALADQVGLVGLDAVDRVAVLVGVDGDRLRAELVRGAEGPDGDLTPVGDEHLGEHAGIYPSDRRAPHPFHG